MDQINQNAVLELLAAMQSQDPRAVEQTELFRLAQDPAVQQQVHAMMQDAVARMQEAVDQMRPAGQPDLPAQTN